MRKSLVGGFAEIFRIAKEDKDNFKYRKQLIGALIRVNFLGRKAGGGPWSFVSGVLLEDNIQLNGVNLKKGDHLCLLKATLKSISSIN